MSLLFTLAQAATQAATSQPAQAVVETASKAWYEHGLLGWYVAGGRFMIPLFICQVIGLGVIIERLAAYRAIRIDVRAFREKVKALLAQRKVDDAIRLCDETPGPVAATLAVGLRRFKLLRALKRPADQIENDVSKAVDDYGVHIVAILERHVPVLATVAALGPLFGFLGTVDGMVIAFADIESAARAGGGQNIVLLAAAGIKVALYTTILGLCIGIAAQWAYNTFTNRINAFVLDVEESVTELLHNLTLLTGVGAQALAADGDATAQHQQPAVSAPSVVEVRPAPAM